MKSSTLDAKKSLGIAVGNLRAAALALIAAVHN
jgi:hypothetical protein